MNKTELNAKPKHKHTCKDCHFLGHTVVGERQFDMYVCLGRQFSYVARWNKNEYYSYPDPRVVAECVMGENS